VIQEWLRAKRCFLWSDVAKRLQEKIDPELRERVERANLQHGLGGGFVSHELFVVFYASMPTEEIGRAHLPVFERIIPYYAQASQRAYPGDLLTNREKLILRHRVSGEITKQIADAVGMTERGVKMHFDHIKKKLGTDDLLNAAVIANMHGMLNVVGE
jgi:DNA-binding CsgD family transcriptional regulator